MRIGGVGRHLERIDRLGAHDVGNAEVVLHAGSGALNVGGAESANLGVGRLVGQFGQSSDSHSHGATGGVGNHATQGHAQRHGFAGGFVGVGAAFCLENNRAGVGAQVHAVVAHRVGAGAIANLRALRGVGANGVSADVGTAQRAFAGDAAGDVAASRAAGRWATTTPATGCQQDRSEPSKASSLKTDIHANPIIYTYCYILRYQLIF